MHLATIIVASLPVLGALAAPSADADHKWGSWGNWGKCGGHHPCTSTTSTAITTTTRSPSTTSSKNISTQKASTTTASSPSSTISPPQTAPTAPYSLIAARSASPVHLLPWNAAGYRFWLGGSTASYCPDSIKNTGSCPPGNVTAFLGTCDMDVYVPGGQQLYVTPGGEIGYAQAHSLSLPDGAHVCPFAYNKPAGSNFGYVTPYPAIAFNATAFIACPTDSGLYQVFANVKNAKVPQGDVSKCLGIDALASDYKGAGGAWQYT